MKLYPLLKSLIIMSLFLVSACYYDVEEDLYPNGTCDTANMSFAQDIQPVLSANCLACHSASQAQGNVVLETHADVLIYANNGKLLGSIRQQAGFVAMPQGQPALSTCTQDRFAAWIADGAPNN